MLIGFFFQNGRVVWSIEITAYISVKDKESICLFIFLDEYLTLKWSLFSSLTVCGFFHFGMSHKTVYCAYSVVNVPGENTSDAKDEKVSQSHLYICVCVCGRMCGNNREETNF